jgi:hypothetical protein
MGKEPTQDCPSEERTSRGTPGHSGRRAGEESCPGLDIYSAELRARDQELPAEAFLDIDLDLLTGHRLRAMWKMEKLRQTGG